ncbi:hypothetical protein FisN_3Hu198 [Fistulifera solaris]|jgi:hypothetical protein|uniref:Uncharacterized protein n=1 Tax=Fistulifera solaris TaxID=1519565 RepID=A0A1Z5JNZ9_FISSO|nr:hypothetical protein FisN_3Hu198 [Fistulifera solaris]|eukprot:GAX15724.1 hypothetical protein FisN_3Hu198 [Fistulifera solaris]
MSFRYKNILRDQYSQFAKLSAARFYPCGTTITTSKRRLTAPSPRFWVPPAYQGGLRTSKAYEQRTGSKKSRDIKGRNEKGRPSSFKVKKKRNTEDAAALLTNDFEEKKARFAETCSNLLLFSRRYKEHLANGSVSAIDKNIDMPSTSITFLTKQLKDAFHDIHSTETTLTWNHIISTELIFREIAAALQEAIVLPTLLAKEERSLMKRKEYADLAEFALSSLLSLRSERALLVKSVYHWSSKVTPPYHRKQTKSSSIKAWVATLFETAARDIPEAGPYTQALQMSGSFAHEDHSLGVSQSMFLAVMETIVSTIPSFRLDSMTLDPHVEPENVHQTLDRLVNLLDKLPSPDSEHGELFAFVMSIFASVGTLESARNSFDYYRRYSHIVPFSLVLNVYCEAARREEDHELSNVIADECFNLVQQEWDESLPEEPLDGVNHLCLALESVFLARGVTEIDMCDRVETLVRRVLASGEYDNILSNAKTQNVVLPPEGPTIHLLDCLIKVLGNCQEEQRIRRAQKLLDYLLYYTGWGGATPSFPSTDACNQLLDGLCWLHRGKPQAVHQEIKKNDLEYSSSLLKFMQTTGKRCCWPTDSTFQSIFRLLSSVAPDDLGEQAEYLLSNMEMRNPISSDPIHISLAMYHRVIGCWVEVANKKRTTGNAFERCMFLLEQMEIQSMPLLLTEKEIRTASVKGLYHTELQPTVRTYKLILGIFQTEANNVGGEISENTEQLFFALVDSINLRGILASEPSLRKRVRNCVQLIARESEEKHRVQALLEDLK